jgi:L-aspartate oxidase
VEELSAEAAAAAARHGVSAPLVELSNLLTCARLILSCALQRKESRGGHFSPDYPGLDPEARPSLVALPPRRVGTNGGVGQGAGDDARTGAGAGAGARGAAGGGAPGSPKKRAKRPAAAPAPAAQREAAHREMAVRSTPRDQE